MSAVTNIYVQLPLWFVQSTDVYNSFYFWFAQSTDVYNSFYFSFVQFTGVYDWFYFWSAPKTQSLFRFWMSTILTPQALLQVLYICSLSLSFRPFVCSTLTPSLLSLSSFKPQLFLLFQSLSSFFPSLSPSLRHIWIWVPAQDSHSWRVPINISILRSYQKVIPRISSLLLNRLQQKSLFGDTQKDLIFSYKRSFINDVTLLFWSNNSHSHCMASRREINVWHHFAWTCSNLELHKLYF